jgi:hypothetical protein
LKEQKQERCSCSMYLERYERIEKTKSIQR